MSSSRVSIYLPEHLERVLDLRDCDGRAGLSQRIAAIVDRYGVMVARHCPPFSRAEWCLILDACNGWGAWAQAGETLMCGIAMEVHDHCRLNGAGAKWDLREEQCADLVRRLDALDAAQTMAVIERIEAFWRRPTMPTDEAMAAAGIVPSDAAPVPDAGG